MREWQVGDPMGTGEDLGVPDIPYMDYLREKGDDSSYDGYYGGYESLEDEYIEGFGSYEAYFRKASGLKNQGDYENAIRYFNKALDYRYEEEAKLEIFECYKKLGQIGNASQVLYDLGFHFNDNDFDKAEKYFKECYALNNNHPDVLWQLALLYKDSGRYKEAIECFEKNIEKKGFCHDASPWHIAHCYNGLKDYKNELKWLDRCLDKNYILQDVNFKYRCLKNLYGNARAIRFYEDSVDYFLTHNGANGRHNDADALKVLETLKKIKPTVAAYEIKSDKILKSHKNSYDILDNFGETFMHFRKTEEIWFLGDYTDNDFALFISYYCKISSITQEEFFDWYSSLNDDDIYFIYDYFGYVSPEKWEHVLCTDRWFNGMYSYVIKRKNGHE